MQPIEEVLEVIFVAARNQRSKPAGGGYDGSVAQIHYKEDGDRTTPSVPGIGSRSSVGIRAPGISASGEQANPMERTVPKVLDSFIKIGDELRAPYNEAPFFGKVMGITGDGVRFQWGEEEITLETPKMPDDPGADGLGVMGGIGPDGEPIPGSQLQAKKPEEPKQRESYKINEHAWFIGADELERIESSHEDLVAEIGVKNMYIPGTNGEKGRLRLVVDKVPEGSLAYQRGFREGDILRTVDGETIQSKASVVSYFKRNTTKEAFTIEIERLGAVVRKTFRVAR